MNVYFMIMQEINRQRERMKKFKEKETPGGGAMKIEHRQVQFLSVNFINYWIKIQERFNSVEMERELRNMNNQDVILMLYLPKMLTPTPKPGYKSEGSSVYSTPGGDED